MRTVILLALFPLFSWGQVAEKYGVDTEHEVPEGLQVGELAPNFELNDQMGKSHSLQNYLTEGPVVVIFYRGEWCGVCNKYFASIKDSVKMIRDMGAMFLAITPENTENTLEMAKDTEVDFPLLSDENDQTMIDYKVRFKVNKAYDRKIKYAVMTSIAENNDQEEAFLPVPATYIIDTNGEITFRHFDLNYKNRASVEMILKELSKLN